MSTKETGGPALPAFPGQRDFGNGCVESWIGMTLRDYFAAKALPYVVDHCTTYSRSAEEAYKIADAMLEARKS